MHTSAPCSADVALVSAAVDLALEDVHQQLLLLGQPPRHTPSRDVPHFPGMKKMMIKKKTKEKRRGRERFLSKHVCTSLL